MCQEERLPEGGTLPNEVSRKVTTEGSCYD